MAGIAYRVLDVFTDRPLAGNPLAVIPEADGLAPDRMQAIAREFNLSETVFVVPSDDPDCLARLRIFAPGMELPFAGHPVIGTAVLLAGLGTVFGQSVGPNFTLETGIGRVPCSLRTAGGLTHATLVNGAPLNQFGTVAPELIAACLDIAPDRITAARHAPTMASKGLPYALVELVDLPALAACRPNSAGFARAEAQHATGQGPFSVYAYVRRGPEACAARMFDPLSGIPEDPATGSAAAALAGFLADLTDAPVRLTIDQGVEMGRPSRIETEARLRADGGSDVSVSGSAVEVMEGTLRL
ncbi:MAG: PhzF family phenazine biosynthesis protein [Pseudomonadota bacterium]